MRKKQKWWAKSKRKVKKQGTSCCCFFPYVCFKHKSQTVQIPPKKKKKKFTTFYVESILYRRLRTKSLLDMAMSKEEEVVDYLEPLMSKELLCKFPDKSSALDFDYTQSSIWSPLVPRAYSAMDLGSVATPRILFRVFLFHFEKFSDHFGCFRMFR